MKRWIPDIICGLLIVLFVYAASSKLFDYTQFNTQLGHSPLIAPYAGIIVWAVPVIELTIVAMLTIRHTRIPGLYASFILLLIFSLYIEGMLLSGTNLPCSCGGVISALSWKQHLVFNLFFIAVSVMGIALSRKQEQDILKSNKIISRE